MSNPDFGGYRPEAETEHFLTVADVREKFVWDGSDGYPERTEAEAWPHLEQYLDGNEYVSAEELAQLGFVRKEVAGE